MTRTELANGILLKVQGDTTTQLSLSAQGGILTPVATPSVSELLSQSRAQHLAYRAAQPRRNTQGQISDGDAIASDAAISEAGKLRAQAELADPQHADPAWLDEPATHDHDELLTFYFDLLHR